MSTSFPKYKLPGASATIALPPNRFKQLTFNAAPAVMEFGVTVGAGTDPVTLTGNIDAPALKAALEACTDLEGYAVEVFGGTQVSGTGLDGVALHSGSFVVAVQGEEPLPVWGAVENSEVQSFVVEEGDLGHIAVSGAGASDFNGNYAPMDSAWEGGNSNVWNDGLVYKLDSGHYAYVDLNKTTWKLTEAIDNLAAWYYSNGGGTTVLVPTSGWNIDSSKLSEGIDPAPTVALGGSYTLNATSPFLLTYSPEIVQASQRALGSVYTEVVVEGRMLSGSCCVVSGAGDDEWNGIYLYRGEMHNTLPVFVKDSTHLIYCSTSGVRTWVLSSTKGGTAKYSSPGNGSDADLAGPNHSAFPWAVITGASPAPGSELLQMAQAHLHSYFPYSAGNIANPSATGTNANATTLHQGGSESELVVATECGLETLLRAALENPAAAPAAPGFTPASNEHWQSPPPANLDEAIHRTAYAMNELFWDQVP